MRWPAGPCQRELMARRQNSASSSPPATSTFLPCRSERPFPLTKQLLFCRLGLGELLLHVRRKRFDPFDVSRDGPQLFVRVPFAVGEHTRKPDPVLRAAKDLRFRVGCPAFGELWNGRIETVTGGVRLSGSPVAPGASIEIDLASGDEILVSGRHGIRYLRSTTPHRSVNRRKHQRVFPSGRRKVGANFGEPKPQVCETAHEQQKNSEQDAAQKIFHYFSLSLSLPAALFSSRKARSSVLASSSRVHCS